MNAFFKWLFTSEMSFEMPSRPITGPPAFLLLLFVLVIVSSIWVSRDAQRRGRSPFLAVVFILLAWWPFSLLWWRWLRPPQPRSTPPPLP